MTSLRTNEDNDRNIKIMKSLDYGETWTTSVDYDNGFDTDNNGNIAVLKKFQILR